MLHINIDIIKMLIIFYIIFAGIQTRTGPYGHNGRFNISKSMLIIPTKSMCFLQPKPRLIFLPKSRLIPLQNKHKQHQSRPKFPNPMAQKPLVLRLILGHIQIPPPPLRPLRLHKRSRHPSTQLANLKNPQKQTRLGRSPQLGRAHLLISTLVHPTKPRSPGAAGLGVACWASDTTKWALLADFQPRLEKSIWV